MLIYSALLQKNKEKANEFIAKLLLEYCYNYDCEKEYVYKCEKLDSIKTYSRFTLLIFSLMMNNRQAFNLLLERHKFIPFCKEIGKGRQSLLQFGEKSCETPAITISDFIWLDQRIKVRSEIENKIKKLKKQESLNNLNLLDKFKKSLTINLNNSSI